MAILRLPRLFPIAFASLSGVFLTGAQAAPQTQPYRLLYAFQGGSDGSNPEAGLTLLGDSLYGTTYGGGSGNCSGGCGTVFSADVATGTVKQLHQFRGNASGAYPAAGLLAVGKKLYGTTFGGSSGSSVVFALHPATGATSIIYTIPDQSDSDADTSLLEVAGTLYGGILYGSTAGGAVFAADPKARTGAVIYTFQSNPDGSFPEGGLIKADNTLFGTAHGGGANGCGTIYTFDAQSHAEQTAYSFLCGMDGIGPAGDLTYVHGIFYGTTEYGGPSNAGTVFSFNPATGAERVVYAFKGGSDGETPGDGVREVGGMLYGVTYNGGASNDGTIFVLNPTTGAETVLHAFGGGSDGANPSARLVESAGTLFGTTTYGGSATNCPGNSGFFVGCGTIFSVTP